MDHFVFGCLLQSGGKIKRLFFYLDESQFWLAATEPAVTFISLCDQALRMKTGQFINASFIEASKCCKGFFFFVWIHEHNFVCMTANVPFQIIRPLAGKVVKKKKNKQTSKQMKSFRAKTKPWESQRPILPLQHQWPKCSGSFFWLLPLYFCVVYTLRWEVSPFFLPLPHALQSHCSSTRHLTTLSYPSCQKAGYEGMSDIILWLPYVTRERVSRVILLERRVAWTGNKTQFASSVPSV